MGQVPPAHQVADFIRALALAWKNLAAYPPGHPALAGSVESAHRSLTDLRGSAGEVSLGIAADGIVYGDDKIDSTQAQKFAQALYGRGVAVVRLAAATTPSDIDTFLRRLTGTPENTTPLWEELTAAGVVNIYLQPVDYSSVQVTDQLTEEEPPKEQKSLWDDILHALVAGHELSPKARQLLTHDIRSVDELSAVMLRYIDTADDPNAEFDPDATFGVRIGGRLPQSDSADAMIARVADSIGAHVASSSGSKRQLAVQQVLQLVRTMPDSLRRAIVRSALRPLATEATAGSLLREISNSLENEEVLEALRYLSKMGKLSDQAIALLESLASLEAGANEPQPAPAALIGELVELFGEEDIDRFNPPDHKALLAEVSIETPRLQPIEQPMSNLGLRVETVAPEAVDRQLGQTLIELLSKYGASRNVEKVLARAARLIRAEITAGLFAEAVDFIQRLEQIAPAAQNPELSAAIGRCFAIVATPEATRALIDKLASAPPDKAALIRRLVEALGAAASRNLLVALSEETNRSRRRRLFDLLASLGPPIVPDVVPLLRDSRWYVVRNMLLLLRGVNDRTSLPEVRQVAQHPDLRVRMEAIKTLITFDSSVPTDLLEDAINDRDPKMAETAIALVGSYAIKEAVGPLLRILAKRDIFGARRPLRLRAIKALGELGDPAALPQMQHLFSTSLLPWPAREERYAAFESLAGYPPDARAPLVERGLQARDPQIRELCRRLTGT